MATIFGRTFGPYRKQEPEKHALLCPLYPTPCVLHIFGAVLYFVPKRDQDVDNRVCRRTHTCIYIYMYVYKQTFTYALSQGFVRGNHLWKAQVSGAGITSWKLVGKLRAETFPNLPGVRVGPRFWGVGFRV